MRAMSLGKKTFRSEISSFPLYSFMLDARDFSRTERRYTFIPKK